jgi:hypothetical protein
MTFYVLKEKISSYLNSHQTYNPKSSQWPHLLIELLLQTNVVNFAGSIFDFLVILLGKLLLRLFNFKRILLSESVVFGSFLS